MKLPVIRPPLAKATTIHPAANRKKPTSRTSSYLMNTAQLRLLFWFLSNQRVIRKILLPIFIFIGLWLKYRKPISDAIENAIAPI